MGLVSSKSDLEVHSTAASTPPTDSVDAIEVAAEAQPSCSSGPGLGFNLMTSSSSFSVSYGLSQIQVNPFVCFSSIARSINSTKTLLTPVT